ncbi:unnamed protein product [Bursaphelenchus xylophilus]|uniref:(pine wood nematode) hypothetical protein n=1 Tax=Bursaphelenchus xylophilus TaxID=6326 RepID=A0A1I7RZW2_BURXY|nr:unnamed protein product [Bursaphelenchus xylophilus]CAG9109188.1 unnamed protein product [Bursaphelenchus xylophilus]
MGRKKIDIEENKRQQQQRNDQLKLLDQEYSFRYLCNAHTHKLVYLLAVVCIIFDVMDAANLVYHKKYVTLSTVGIRTLFDIFLLVGNRTYREWMYIFFLFSKVVQTAMIVFYMFYLALTLTDVIKHSERFDKYLAQVERTPDAVSGAYIALTLLLTLLAVVIYLVVRDYYYVKKKKEIVGEFEEEL